MKIGITYDLREEYLALGYGAEETAEFDRVDTIDSIEGALLEGGFETERIGSYRSLVAALAAGKRWDMVFNICEGMYGYGREALVPCLLDAYQIPYTFSDPLVNTVTLHKGVCKRVLRSLGVPTPDFAVVETMDQLSDVQLPYPLFVKPVAEGTGKGISATSRVGDAAQLETVCREMIEKYRQPVLVETYLPGAEYTVGIVGTGAQARSLGILGVRVKTADEVYSFESKEYCEEMVDYCLAQTGPELEEELTRVALDAWRGMGCRDGGRVDLKLDQAGAVQFLEINPLAGLHPHHSDLPIICGLKDIPYRDLIGWIMASALARMEYENRRTA